MIKTILSLIIVVVSFAPLARADHLSAQVKFASDYNFRGLRQYFNLENQPIQRSTVQSALDFNSDSGFVAGLEGISLINDLELRLKAGFNLPFESAKFATVYQRYQFENRPDFEEVIFTVNPYSSYSFQYVLGIASAGNGYSTSYQPQINERLSLNFEAGFYAPSATQVGQNLGTLSEYYRAGLQQNYFGVTLGVDYYYRIGTESLVVFNIGAQWLNPIGREQGN